MILNSDLPDDVVARVAITEPGYYDIGGVSVLCDAGDVVVLERKDGNWRIREQPTT